MELRENIIGFSLLQINKMGGTVKIKLHDPLQKRNLQLVFEGLSFETPALLLNQRISRTDLSRTLGFKAISQLRYMGYNTDDFMQLLIVLEKSTDAFKQEIICVFTKYSLQKI